MLGDLGFLQIGSTDSRPSVCVVLLESRRRIFKAEQRPTEDDGFVWNADHDVFGGKWSRQDNDHGEE